MREVVGASKGLGGLKRLLILLHEMQSDLRMHTLGPVNNAIGEGYVFDYFDNLRKLIVNGVEEVFFVDAYLDPEFISRYLPQVRAGVAVRLLTAADTRRMQALKPAVELLARQNGISIGLRSSAGLHDRYLFIDRRECYSSGASFKDGAKRAGTTITQMIDTFSAVFQLYEQKWASGTAIL